MVSNDEKNSDRDHDRFPCQDSKLTPLLTQVHKKFPPKCSKTYRTNINKLQKRLCSGAMEPFRPMDQQMSEGRKDERCNISAAW